MSPLSTPAPRAVTFDCWNTLLYEADWQLAHAFRVDALQRAATEGDHPVERGAAGDAFDLAWGRHMELWQREKATGALEVAHWALEELGIPPEGVALEHLVENWQEASHSGRVEALSGARETLYALRAGGLRTALICDTGLTPGRVVRHHLDRHGLLEHLEVCVFSDEVGEPKPRARVFHAALEPLGVEAAHAVHVGDLKRTDVAGAHGVGMRAVRITERHDDPSELPEADVVVADHSALRALLTA
ncbi:MAG: HAD family hydrolase [Deltaproteobacteria bacterium]|nr:HAD family hydrolase [Deltaproteobacteria bacterium]